MQLIEVGNGNVPLCCFNRITVVSIRESGAVCFGTSVGCNVQTQGSARHQLDSAGTAWYSVEVEIAQPCPSFTWSKCLMSGGEAQSEGEERGGRVKLQWRHSARLVKHPTNRKERANYHSPSLAKCLQYGRSRLLSSIYLPAASNSFRSTRSMQ